MTKGRRALAALALAGLIALVSCARTGPADPSDVAQRSDAVVIGAFNFTESKILAEVYAQALRDAGTDAEVLGEVASREIMEPALEQSQVDLVPEYLGTILTFLGADPPDADTTVAEARRALEAAFGGRGIRVMQAAPGENRNEIVVTETFAVEHALEKISDLRRVDQDVAFGGPAECLSRPLCMVGLEDVYGLRFREFKALDSGGPATIAALTGSEVDVALLFTTNPQIAARGLVVLEDDRHLQPPENVVPVVRTDTAEALGAGPLGAVDRVTSRLSDETLRHLNGLVEIDGMTPAAAAASWLESEDLVGGGL